MRSIILGIALLAIFAFVSQVAQMVLQIVLAIAFILALFISVLIDLGNRYETKAEKEEFENSLEGELAEEASEPEEAETIVVEAESPRGANRGT